MAEKIYDVVVVGGGAVGLAATYEVAKAGKSVVVLEQYCFYNQAGSSGDLARMYRTMYTEDFMAKLAKESLDIWTEFEKDAGVSLRQMTGLLNFGDPEVGKESPEGTLRGPIENLEKLKMPFTEYHNPWDIQKKWPFKNLPSFTKGVFAPDNGIINVPLLLRTLSRLAKDYGAHSRQGIEVQKVVPDNINGEKIWRVKYTKNDEVSTDSDENTDFLARKLILTPGAFVNHITEPSFKGLTLDLDIWEMVASYWSVNPGPGGTVFPSMWFQFAKNVPDTPDGRSRLFYGFPALEWGPPNLCRIAVDAATYRVKDPKDRRSTVISHQDVQDCQEFIRDHVVGVDPTVPASSLTCLMTNVYDNMFVMDYIPDEFLPEGVDPKSVVLFTAGWAMKFVPLLGKALKEMVLDGGSDYALDQFLMTREDKEHGKSVISRPRPLADKVANISSLTMNEPQQACGSSIHYVSSF